MLQFEGEPLLNQFWRTLAYVVAFAFFGAAGVTGCLGIKDEMPQNKSLARALRKASQLCIYTSLSIFILLGINEQFCKKGRLKR